MIGEKNVLEIYLGFPDSSVGKESVCNAGDPGSIPGLGRSTGEGIGYSLQYSWASLVAQQRIYLQSIWRTVVLNLTPIVQERWLGQH